MIEYLERGIINVSDVAWKAKVSTDAVAAYLVDLYAKKDPRISVNFHVYHRCGELLVTKASSQEEAIELALRGEECPYCQWRLTPGEVQVTFVFVWDADKGEK